VKKAIKKTLAYAKDFGMELNLEELWQRLISRQVYARIEVKKAVKKMGLNLGGKNGKETRKKMMEAKRVLKKIADNDKNILFLGVTGSVAGGNAKENDDIDIMVVCKKNRLWWCRWRLKIFLKKKGIKHREAGKREEQNAFCFNLWMEEDSLKIPLSRQNKKTAMDLILMKPVIKREKNYEKFMRKNFWVKKWVATGYKNKKRRKGEKGKNGPKVHREKEKNLVLDIVNLFMFWGQYVYMKPKMKGELVEFRRAFFHRK